LFFKNIVLAHLSHKKPPAFTSPPKGWLYREK
jgi:hypothetical protein